MRVAALSSIMYSPPRKSKFLRADSAHCSHAAMAAELPPTCKRVIWATSDCGWWVGWGLDRAGTAHGRRNDAFDSLAGVVIACRRRQRRRSNCNRVDSLLGALQNPRRRPTNRRISKFTPRPPSDVVAVVGGQHMQARRYT